MTEKRLRRRLSSNRRRHLPSPTKHRRSSRRLTKSEKALNILQRSRSEPALLISGFSVRPEEDSSPPDAVLSRPQTCADIFSPPYPENSFMSPRKNKGYNKDSKVVVNVTVEGCPGPIRSMVKLGSTVEETIRLIVRKYVEEGRSPRLDPCPSSAFELLHSYFSLHSLDTSEMIGDLGSRSFYLRKGNRDGGENHSASSISAKSTDSPPQESFPSFVCQKVDKIIRRARKIWKILGCMQCSG